MTDLITGPGNYCRADGVKVRVEHLGYDGWWFSPDHQWGWDNTGKTTEGPNIISTWSDRPPEFRKPRPAYRKDGTSRWPVGTRAVLVGGENFDNSWAVGCQIIVTDDGPRWVDYSVNIVKCYPKGHRPLFRKLPEPAPMKPTEAHGGNPRDMRPDDKAFFGLDGPQTMVLYGVLGGLWNGRHSCEDTHRLTLQIDTAGNVTGKMEAV